MQRIRRRLSHNTGACRFAELVEEKTGGRIKILVKADGVLGDEKTVIEQIQFGGVDFARVSLSPLAEFVPRLNVLQMPYLYTGRENICGRSWMGRSETIS